MNAKQRRNAHRVIHRRLTKGFVEFAEALAEQLEREDCDPKALASELRESAVEARHLLQRRTK